MINYATTDGRKRLGHLHAVLDPQDFADGILPDVFRHTLKQSGEELLRAHESAAPGESPLEGSFEIRVELIPFEVADSYWPFSDGSDDGDQS